MTTESKRAALRKFMVARKLKVYPWTKAAGVPESTLRKYLAEGTTSMRHDTLEKLARAADATVAEMFGEKVPPPRGIKDIVAIRRLKVAASMGGGYEIVDEQEGEPIYFRRNWIDGILGGEMAQLRAIDLTGQSMLPTFRDGDIAIAQLHGNFESGRCYALWDGRGLVVKRLETSIADPERLRVISDNAAMYAPYEVHAEEIHIIAKILWRGGRV